MFIVNSEAQVLTNLVNITYALSTGESFFVFKNRMTKRILQPAELYMAEQIMQPNQTINFLLKPTGACCHLRERVFYN